ncbi:MinD/ParA family protein [Dactylosporangium sp. NPDC048998]|uniref:MinD/ParA family ATP-binding protein n=1 Tax=Dactylosporangium sp. NPDC048998 TaxID=3363976 RepID=UPI003721EF0E
MPSRTPPDATSTRRRQVAGPAVLTGRRARPAAVPVPPSYDHVREPRPVPRELSDGSALRRAWLRAASLRPGCPPIVVSSADGGVGRSTIVAALGAVLAAATPDPPAAVDATARGWGGLEHRVLRRNDATIWDLFAALLHTGGLDRAALDAAMQHGTSGLHTAVGEVQRTATRRPTLLSESLRVVEALRGVYPLVLIDAPVADVAGVWGLLHPPACPVLVARAGVDSVQHTMRLLAQLRGVGMQDAAARAVVVVAATVPRPAREVRAAVRQLAGAVSAVVSVPFDEHLARPEPVDLGRMRKPTRHALVELADAVLAACPADPDVAADLLTGTGRAALAPDVHEQTPDGRDR